jgi:hypothetical protein
MTLSRNIRVSRALPSNGPRITAQDTTQAARLTWNPRRPTPSSFQPRLPKHAHLAQPDPSPAPPLAHLGRTASPADASDTVRSSTTARSTRHATRKVSRCATASSRPLHHQNMPEPANGRTAPALIPGLYEHILMRRIARL